jgi:hypothetical protein
MMRHQHAIKAGCFVSLRELIDVLKVDYRPLRGMRFGDLAGLNHADEFYCHSASPEDFGDAGRHVDGKGSIANSTLLNIDRR